jgi:hypothetical protein
MGKKISRNDLCPCGSGKKYKHCCIDKDFDWEEHKGENVKVVQFNDVTTELLKQQRQKFVEKFGREPGPNDPVFFDTSEEELTKYMVNMLRLHGYGEDIIYAYRVTGRVVTDENRKFLSDAEIKEWDDVLKNYKSVN